MQKLLLILALLTCASGLCTQAQSPTYREGRFGSTRPIEPTIKPWYPRLEEHDAKRRFREYLEPSFTVNGVTFQMVLVKGGSFEMGSQESGLSQPAHTEIIRDFYIGKTEVTQALWQAVMGRNPSYFKGDNLPVETVSWDDCREFITRLNKLTGKTFRLPTEAEWEYAARGGNRSCGYTYSGSNDIGSVAWYEENSGGTTHPVAQKLSNELGLYDMSGNVSEWTADNAGSEDSLPYNGSYRVSRGCGWNDSASDLRDADCNCFQPAFRNSCLGLRLALDPDSGQNK